MALSHNDSAMNIILQLLLHVFIIISIANEYIDKVQEWRAVYSHGV